MKKIFGAIGRFFGAIGRGIKNFLSSILLGFLILILRPWFRNKTVGKKLVNKSDEGRVFVANHLELYGPIVMKIRFPYRVRPWVIDKLMDDESVEAQVRPGLEKNFKWAPKFLKEWAIKFVRFMMTYTMKKMKGIPVHLHDIKNVMETIDVSVNLLDKGKNILIFPEEYESSGGYLLKGVGEFRTGFAQLGRSYYQATGKRLAFYPVYISKENKRTYILEPTYYDPSVPAPQEKKRIVKYLHDTMLAKALEVENFDERETACEDNVADTPSVIDDQVVKEVQVVEDTQLVEDRV